MKLMRMCRRSKDGITWEECWIKDGTYNIEKKRNFKNGYIYFKPSIVTRKVVQ